VPLVGTCGKLPTKFTLGNLALLRGRTIDDVLRESVLEYSKRLNINNTTELAAYLGKLSVDVTKVNARFADLENLMQRRHIIVHQADRNDARGRGQHRARSLHPARVDTWAAAVDEFGEAFFVTLAAL